MTPNVKEASVEKPKYVIEKGVPIPPEYAPRGLCAAIRKMAVGDSILLDDTHSRRATCYAFAKRAGYKIVSRKAEDGKFRLWRTA